MDEWMIWTVIAKGFATKEELETTWSLDDLLRAVAYISATSDIDGIPPRK